MHVLLVEPDCHRLTPARARQAADVGNGKPDDDALWCPPLGLMKLSTFHKKRGDFVRFVYGCEKSVLDTLWDRVYVTTVFTFGWGKTVRAINFYKNAAGGVAGNVYVGGVMASIMPDELYEATGIYPYCGIVDSARKLGFADDVDIDLLPHDYDLVDNTLYSTNDTYYAYASRGCVNRCSWCAVPCVEPTFVSYIDIKPNLRAMRVKYGDKSVLKLMDNNVLASSRLKDIVEDLCALGYGRGSFANTERKRQRVVDFNQGLDASFVNDRTMALLSRLNIKPFRIAFDRFKEKQVYLDAIRTARQYGFRNFSTYMLYNWRDTPKDLFERLSVNIQLNAKWREKGNGAPEATVFSYPMRYAPIHSGRPGERANRFRDPVRSNAAGEKIGLANSTWNPRFVRNIEIMKSATHGAISTTPGLASRTIGESFEEFLCNLYMPEVLLRHRNKHEKRIYECEPARKPGSGKVEAFREFVLRNLRNPSDAFDAFHAAVSVNRKEAAREWQAKTSDEEIRKWLRYYVAK